ncbi:hypothetical protein SAMN06269173_11385 [Hymenobacter mucosus]|uniref:Uncharacterized protein n=1 Tax=Hymenobacter mucosus TaxID=1411120 RepID=A0A239ALK9_9BACT|nr:hypothetical protein SAMN06269173_11385 [Hymenobacter mucosus]
MDPLRYLGPTTVQWQHGQRYAVSIIFSRSQYCIYFANKPQQQYQTLQELLSCWEIRGFASKNRR